MEGIIFSDLDKYLVADDKTPNAHPSDKWQIMSYRCGEVSGNLLYAGELTQPSDVTLRLGLSGYYKIYVATVKMRSKNLFNLKLTSDEAFHAMSSPTMESKYTWMPTEYFEEFLWRAADLTNEDIILRKPECMWNNACALAFIRCVPITKEECDAYLTPSAGERIHGHFDEDPNGEDSLVTDSDLLTRYGQLIGGNINEMAIEFSFDYDITDEGLVNILKNEIEWQKRDERFILKKEIAYKMRVDYLHSHGIKAYAANRMSVASFTAPYSHWKNSFSDSHPEFYCRTRLGDTVNVCSYAYPEVRKYVIDRFVDVMKHGFDGVTLILHRGIHVAFEEPVIREFTARYPGVDPTLLPVTDERLNGVFSYFMTEFMKELRAALAPFCDGRAKINVITEYTPDTSRHFGIDVAEWARLGLIDRVLQGIMEVYEDLDGLTDKNGLIDKAKYSERILSAPVIKRYHTTDLCKAIDGSKKYLDILSGTGVEYSAALPWSHRVAYSKIEEYKAALREIGVSDFLAWNTNHTLLDVAEMHAVLGRGEEYYTVNRYRTQMLDGSNVSDFNPNWRG